ncbi:mitochondrial pyruvate carrier 3-like [Chenopodium quinoa]|uniref:mitochondrial pyruvate carrier 3-like n=1 Tax=Chenopodium quinoa TaxID=63459 RepID=UPI000B79A2CA|nr:mitochondrial pyruvate carrier 3-like [Chenopodium quinoa]
MAATKFQAFLNHPAGPKTIHFWAPAFKWGVTIANVVDYAKPADQISYPQQAAIVTSGAIWAKYSTVITPKNWSLFSVSVAMVVTGAYQLIRKYEHDSLQQQENIVLKEA